MPIDAVVVGDRSRQDLGDLTQLKASIAGVGLLQPIVVRADGLLIAGGRRLQACKELGWSSILVRVPDGLNDARRMLESERDENICRLDMKPSEKVALGRKLEALHAPQAEEIRRQRISEGGKRRWANQRAGGIDPVKFPESTKTPETRDVIGEAIGLSGVSYQRAKVVVELAETGAPEAVEALAAMDKTGKITPSYEKATGRKTKTSERKSSGGSARATVPLGEALKPLRKWLKDWTPEKLKGTTPAQAKRLLAMTSETRDALFEVERALSERTVVSRALR